MNRREQLASYDSGVDILVATPGRLKDFVAKGSLKLNNVSFLILDECDRMLDMGFEPDMRHLILECFMPNKQERHTFLTSATIPENVIKLADEFMKEPILITVGYLGKTPNEIKQELF